MFYEELKRLRLREGLTQKDLSEYLGVTQTTIANYEKGIRFPDEKVIVKLADCFHVSLDELFGRRKSIPPEKMAGNNDYLKLFRDLMKDFESRNDRDIINRFLGFLPRAKQIDLIEKVLIPVLAECGRLWETGRMNIAGEHYVTEVISELIIRMSDYYHRHMFHTDRIQVMAVTAGLERHTLGLQMLMSLLKERGIRTHFLGAQIPSSEIIQSLQTITPAVLVLFTNQFQHIESAENLMMRIKQDFPEIKIVMATGLSLKKSFKKESADLITHDFLTALLQIEHWVE